MNKILELEQLKQFNIDEIIQLYKQGYRLNTNSSIELYSNKFYPLSININSKPRNLNLINALQTNLIQNPGFETQCGSLPCNWTFSTANGITPTLDNTIFHSGTFSIKISNPTITDLTSGKVISDIIPANPGTSYIISGWGKSEGILGTSYPMVYLGEYDSNKVYIKQTALKFLKGTSNWTQQSMTVITGITTAYVKIYANLSNTYGTFWIDDLHLDTSCGTIIPNFIIG